MYKQYAQDAQGHGRAVHVSHQGASPQPVGGDDGGAASMYKQYAQDAQDHGRAVHVPHADEGNLGFLGHATSSLFLPNLCPCAFSLLWLRCIDMGYYGVVMSAELLVRSWKVIMTCSHGTLTLSWPSR